MITDVSPYIKHVLIDIKQVSPNTKNTSSYFISALLILKKYITSY